MKKLSLFLTLIALFWATRSFSQAGSPDPSFGGGDGFLTNSFLTDGHAQPNAVAIQPDGRIVVVGATWIPFQLEQIVIARYMPNGSPDPTFSDDGKATVSHSSLSVAASDVLILPNGKILCAGNAWNNTENFFLLARFNADGTPDNTFDTDGILTTKVGISYQGVGSLAMQPDGKIVVGGYANFTGYDDFVLLRYNANSTLDLPFGGGDGIVNTPMGESYAGIEKVLIQPDGKIVAAGNAVVNGFEDFALARYNSNGTLDNSFSGDGIAMLHFTDNTDYANAAALQPDGKIVLAGEAYNMGAAVARFNANGTLDNTFSGDGLTTQPAIDGARSIIIQPDGKFLLGSDYRVLNNVSQYHFAVARLTEAGLPDFSFGTGDGVAKLTLGPTNDQIQAMALQADGKLVAAGTAYINGRHNFGVARFLTGLTVGTSAPEVFSGNISLYPNPVAEQAMLEYELAVSENVEINLYNIQGRFIQNILPSTEKPVGKHTETLLFASDLPPGTYLLTIETKSGITAIEAIF